MQALRTVFFSGPQDRSLKAQMSQTVETCKRKQHFQSIQLKKIRSPSIKLRELTTDSCEIDMARVPPDFHHLFSCL